MEFSVKKHWSKIRGIYSILSHTHSKFNKLKSKMSKNWVIWLNIFKYLTESSVQLYTDLWFSYEKNEKSVHLCAVYCICRNFSSEFKMFLVLAIKMSIFEIKLQKKLSKLHQITRMIVRLSFWTIKFKKIFKSLNR